MIKKINSLFLLSILFGCAPSMKSTFIDTSNSLMLVEKIIFLDVYDVVPREAIRIGQAKYGDTGISTDCGCKANFLRAKGLAVKNKSNIVKIVKIKKPNTASTCCRMEIEFYYYEGDLSKLDQINPDSY